MENTIIRRCLIGMAFICLTCLNGLAQYSIKGKIIDSQSQPIEGVNVQIILPDSAANGAATTDSNGLFLIKESRQGACQMVLTHVKYYEKIYALTIVDKDIDMGELRMENKSNVINEIQITADHIVKKKDGMVIYPRKNDLKFAGSGYDVLYNLMIPGMVVDRDKGMVTRLGTQVSIYLNGQKVENYHIQPPDIQRISQTVKEKCKQHNEYLQFNFKRADKKQDNGCQNVPSTHTSSGQLHNTTNWLFVGRPTNSWHDSYHRRKL